MPWVPITTRSTGYLFTASNFNDVANNLNFLDEVNYTAFTSDVAISATTVGTANQIVSSGAITYEAVPHMIEFYSPRWNAGTGACNLIIRDGTTVLGTLTQFVASVNHPDPYEYYRVTPTAASHTYNIAAWLGASGGSPLMRAGSGGSAGDATTFVPGFIRITRVPT